MAKPVRRLYEFGDFRLDPENGHLWRAGEITSLPPRAVALLQFLLRHPGQVITKQQLVETVWADAIVEDSNLTQTIYYLRKTLTQPDDPTPLIETIPRVGYRWVAEVREVAPAETARQATISAPAAGLPEIPAAVTTEAGVNEAERATEAEVGVEVSRPAVPSTVPPTVRLRAARFWWQHRAVKVSLLGVALALAVLSGILLGRRSAPAVASVAVLPFTSLATEQLDPELSVGLADALITRLGALGKIEVRQTAAVFRYQGKTPDALNAGRELKVAAVLSGLVHRRAGRMRVTVQLVRVSDGQTLWAGTFDEQFTHLFDLQDDMATQVAGALALPLSGAEWQRLRRQRTDSLEAYRLYLKGRYFWNKRRWEEIKKGIECFEQAIRIDPNYAQAWAGLADSYALVNPEMTPHERLQKAKPAAEKALALDDRLAEAQASLGFIKYKFEWDWRGAESSFKRALELNPNYATAHHWYGESLGLTGRYEEAFAQLEQAERLDPLSLPIKVDSGMAYYRARQYDRALRKMREVLELDPSFVRARGRLAEVYQVQGRYAEAFAELTAVWTQNGLAEAELAQLQQAFQRAGWLGLARQEITRALADNSPSSGHRLAQLSLRAGDQERALEWLEQSFAELGEGPLRMKDPEWDALRAEPQFRELLRRAGHTP